MSFGEAVVIVPKASGQSPLGSNLREASGLSGSSCGSKAHGAVDDLIQLIRETGSVSIGEWRRATRYRTGLAYLRFDFARRERTPDGVGRKLASIRTQRQRADFEASRSEWDVSSHDHVAGLDLFSNPIVRCVRTRCDHDHLNAEVMGNIDSLICDDDDGQANPRGDGVDLILDRTCVAVNEYFGHRGADFSIWEFVMAVRHLCIPTLLVGMLAYELDQAVFEGEVEGLCLIQSLVLIPMPGSFDSAWKRQLGFPASVASQFVN